MGLMGVIQVQSLAKYKFYQTHFSRLFEIFVSLLGAIIVPFRSVTLLYHEIFFRDFDIFLKIDPSSSGLVFCWVSGSEVYFVGSADSIARLASIRNNSRNEI